MSEFKDLLTNQTTFKCHLRPSHINGEQSFVDIFAERIKALGRFKDTLDHSGNTISRVWIPASPYVVNEKTLDILPNDDLAHLGADVLLPIDEATAKELHAKTKGGSGILQEAATPAENIRLFLGLTPEGSKLPAEVPATNEIDL